MNLKSFSQAEEYILKTTPQTLKMTFAGQKGLERAKEFLKELGNPQDKLKVIHVVGTSGKGSTAYLTSLALESLGFKTGLHLSPHIVDMRERTQINNELVGKEKFVSYLNEIIPAIQKIQPTYFELLVGLAFYIFWKEKVDYAIIEAGLGGLYDGTNVTKNKLVIITKIALDHTRILGDTLEKIAEQKAGAVQKGNLVVTTKANFPLIKPYVENYICTSKNFEVKTALRGNYQKENCDLALTAVEVLSKRDNFDFNKEKMQEKFLTAYLLGRFEVINDKVILDAAHNPDKMLAFCDSLKDYKEKFDFLIAVKKNKDYKKMLNSIEPLANKITFTSFFSRDQDLWRLSEKPEKLAKEVTVKSEVIEDSKEAFYKAMKTENKLVVTGSIYLLSEIYPLVEKLRKA